VRRAQVRRGAARLLDCSRVIMSVTVRLQIDACLVLSGHLMDKVAGSVLPAETFETGKTFLTLFLAKFAIERRSNFGNLPSVNLLAPELFFLF